MNPIPVSIEVAWQMWKGGQPFRVQLRYRGPNPNNKSGWSDKWWSLSYDGTPKGQIRCNHGKTGSTGRSKPIEYTMPKAVEKCREKLGEGYDYTPRTSTKMPTPSRAASTPKVVLTGPYAEIRLLRQVSTDHFRAFDGKGAFLLDLDGDGAEQVSNADTFRIQVERLAS